jgi:hypothetical protein
MTPEQENKLLKELLYCTKRSCNNCGKVNCENFQRQRIDCCGLWVSYKDYIKELEKENAELKADNDARKFAMGMSEKVEKQLREENAGLKARLNAINLLTPELEKLSKLKTQQLTKAFEKEAEEYGLQQALWCSSECGDLRDAFKDGAEFGYNKCFEQLRKIVNEGTRLDCIIPELLRLQESE